MRHAARTSLSTASLLLLLAAAAAAAAGCTNEVQGTCFVAGTLIRTPNGGAVPIETLCVGDLVLSPAVEDGSMRVVVRRIEAVLRARVDDVRIIHVANRRIVTTNEHPFWDAERRAWVRAADLRTGMTLAMYALDDDGIAMRPATVERLESVHCATSIDVFNLTVEGPEHTYFAADIAVHNKSQCSGDCGPQKVPLVDPRHITFVNNDASDARVAIIPISEVDFDERVLSGELDVELPPADAFGQTAPPETIAVEGSFIAPGTGNDSELTTPQTVVFELNGVDRYLAHGNGEIVIRRAEGKLEAVLSQRKATGVAGELPLKLTPLYARARGRNAPACTTKDVPTLAFDRDLVTGAANTIGSSYVASAPNPDPNGRGCNAVVLTSTEATTTQPARTICTPTGMPWPFEAGATLRAKPIQHLKDAIGVVGQLESPEISGVRLEAALGGSHTFIEVAQVVIQKESRPQPRIPVVTFLTDTIRFKEEAGCELPMSSSSPTPECGTTSLRARISSFQTEEEISVTNPLPLALPSGADPAEGALLDGSVTPVAFPCSPRALRFSVVAWSKK